MPRNKSKPADVAGPPVKLRRSERIRGKNSDPSSLLDLNDDCISEILLYMSEGDLLALKKSCCRLENLTEECVRSKYKDVLFEVKPTERSHNFLREFGKVLTRLTIDKTGLHHTTFLHQAETYLLQDFTNLRELSMVDVNISEDFVNQTDALCRNLKYLSISFFDTGICNNNLGRFVRACTQLERLSVYGQPGRGESISIQFLAFRYPKLKEISIRKHYHADLYYRRADIQKFLKQNPQIERVTFDLQNTEISSQILQDVLNYLKGVKSIQIRLTEFDESFVIDVAQLHRLHNLVELNINCGFRRIGSAIDALASTNLLETLGLTETYWDDELLVALGKMTKLKTLKLYEIKAVSKNSVQRLSEIQQSLVHFHLAIDTYLDNVRIDEDEYGAFETAKLFVEYYPRMQTLTWTRLLYLYCFIELECVLGVSEFVEFAAARKRSKALNPLTVLLNSRDFKESMRDIPADVLHREMCYVQLKEDVELSYATQLD